MNDTINNCKESDFIIKSELGFITKCECCDTYNVHLGALTLSFKDRELHSLFYMLLKTLRHDRNDTSGNH